MVIVVILHGLDTVSMLQLQVSSSSCSSYFYVVVVVLLLNNHLYTSSTTAAVCTNLHSVQICLFNNPFVFLGAFPAPSLI